MKLFLILYQGTAFTHYSGQCLRAQVFNNFLIPNLEKKKEKRKNILLMCSGLVIFGPFLDKLIKKAIQPCFWDNQKHCELIKSQTEVYEIS